MFAFTCSTKQNVGALKTFMKGRIILPAKNDDKYVKECIHVTHHKRVSDIFYQKENIRQKKQL